jgi:DNA gyrase subunit B
MLSDCISKDRAVAELYIVQGTVAPLTKSTRDRFAQAVLPLNENIVGLHQASIEEVLDDEDFKAFTACLGIGISLSELDPNDDGFMLALDRLRYGKVIIATEESEFGDSFRDEILALLRRFMPPVIDAGHVFTCPIPPLCLASEAKFEEAVMNPATRTERGPL